MPLYEYECTTCRRRTEKIQKFSDPELTVCPFCGGALERTLTAPAVHFAGGGWYKDLYSSAKPPAAPASGEAKAGGAEAPAAGSSSGEGGPAPAAAPAAAAAPPPATPAPATGKSEA